MNENGYLMKFVLFSWNWSRWRTVMWYIY